ncbi:MAG TPA: hypothetical protein VMG12_24605 [Polyangiaceae bacterium]|nr:hypothetical protein [Polyangiaceae bacterium]
MQRETPVETSAGAHAWGYRRVLSIAYRVALIAVVVVAAVHALSAVWHFTIDDAGISYAYAKHLAQGEGPVAVVGGPWIEGYSNPLWVFLLVPLQLVGLPLAVAAKWLGALLFGLGLAAGIGFVARVDGRPWRAFGAPEAAFAVGVALCAELVVWVPAGLENALFSALLLGMLWLDAREAQRPEAFPLSALCAFGLAITRPEAVMYAAPLVAIKLVQALRGREPMRQARRAALLFGVPLVVYHLGHYLVFHELVPNTYYAKPSWHGGPEYLRSTATDSGLLYALPLALLGLFSPPRRVVLAAWACIAGSAFVLYSGGDWMPHARFLSLFGPCVLLLAARGASLLARLGQRSGARLSEPLSERHARGVVLREALGLVLAGAALLPWAKFQLPRLADIRESNWCHFCERVSDTERLQKLATRAGLPSHSLVTQDFGGPSWQSDAGFYPLDFLGLCDRSIVLIRGKRARGGVRNELRFYQYLIHEQPTPPSWVYVPPNFWPGFDRSFEHEDYFELEPRLLPRARRDAFFTLHRGELVDYFPPLLPEPVSPEQAQALGDALAFGGFRLFADPAAAEGATLVPGARVLALLSLVPHGKPNGSEQVTVELGAGAATASSATLRFDRGIDGVARQLAPGEPLGFELPLVVPEGAAPPYRFSLRVSRAERGKTSTSPPRLLPLAELAAGAPLPRFERVLPRFPAALPPPTEPELRTLRPKVTTAIERSRLQGRAAPGDEALSRRLATLSSELEQRGQPEQAYLAAVWATQVDRSAWGRLAEDVHRLRPFAGDDEHPTEMALLRRYYASGTTSDLARLVAFYLAQRRSFEADYFLQRWASASEPEALAPTLHEALSAELRAQLGGDVRGAASILAQVAVDPLDGAGDFENESLDAWDGPRDAYRAGPELEVKGLRGQHGRGVLASLPKGEAATGALTSREFRLDGRVLSLLVGGGAATRKTGVELWVDGEKQLSASGNDSENLWPVFWDVSRFPGKLARLRVFDNNKRTHVLVDRILLWR